MTIEDLDLTAMDLIREADRPLYTRLLDNKCFVLVDHEEERIKLICVDKITTEKRTELYKDICKVFDRVLLGAHDGNNTIN